MPDTFEPNCLTVPINVIVDASTRRLSSSSAILTGAGNKSLNAPITTPRIMRVAITIRGLEILPEGFARIALPKVERIAAKNSFLEDVSGGFMLAIFEKLVCSSRHVHCLAKKLTPLQVLKFV